MDQQSTMNPESNIQLFSTPFIFHASFASFQADCQTLPSLTFSDLTRFASLSRITIADFSVFLLQNRNVKGHDLISPLLVTELQSIADEVPKVNYSTTTETTTETDPLNNVATLILKNYTDIIGNYKRLIGQARFSHDKAISTLRRIYPNSDPELQDAITKIESSSSTKVESSSSTKIQFQTTGSSSDGEVDFIGTVDTVQKALQHVLGLDVQLTFDMMKDDLRGITLYLGSIFRRKDFNNTLHQALPLFVSDIVANVKNQKISDKLIELLDDNQQTNQDCSHPANEYVQEMSSFIGQQPMYVSKLPQPMSLTGRGPSSTIAGKHLLRIPQPHFFQQLDPTEIFFTPSQSILLVGTLCETITARQIKINKELQHSQQQSPSSPQQQSQQAKPEDDDDDQQIEETYSNYIILDQVSKHPRLKVKFDALQQSKEIEQLAQDLKMDKMELIGILLTCSVLMFRFHNLGSSDGPKVVIAPAGDGKSTLYLMLLITTDHLNIPVSYVANEFVVRPHLQSISSAEGMRISKLIYHGFHSNHIANNPIPKGSRFTLFTSTTYLLPRQCKPIVGLIHYSDYRDTFYTYSNWSEVYDTVKKRLPRCCVAFTFSSAGKNLSTSVDKSALETLSGDGIYPFFFNPTITNYLKGTIQLQFYRKFNSLLNYSSSISSIPTSSLSTTASPLTTSTMSEEKYSDYFGKKLYQLVEKYYLGFIQHLSSSQFTHQSASSIKSPLSTQTEETSQFSMPGPTTTQQPSTTPLNFNYYHQLVTKFINDPQHYPLYSEIITNPIPDALTYKQISIFNSDQYSRFLPFSLFISSLKILPRDDIQHLHDAQPQSNHSLKGKKLQKMKNTITIPPLYYIPKHGPATSLIIDPGSFKSYNNIIPNQQKWYNFHQSLQSSSSSTTTEITLPSLNLFTTIHELWYDLSLLQTHLIPNTRYFNFLTQNTQQRSVAIHYDDASNNSIPLLKATNILPQINPKSTQFETINVLEQYHGLIHPRFAEKSPNTPIVHNKSSVGFELFFIDSLLHRMDKCSVYLPFHGFHHQPITKVLSYNNFLGIRLQTTSPHLEFKTLQEATRQGFLDELSLLVKKSTYESIFVAPPTGFPCADFFYIQRHNNKTTQLLCLQLSADTQSSMHANDALLDLLDDAKFPVSDVAYSYITNDFLPILPIMNNQFFSINEDPCCVGKVELVNELVKKTQGGVVYLKRDGKLIENDESTQIQLRSMDSINNQAKSTTIIINENGNLNLFLDTPKLDLLQSFQQRPHRFTFRLNQSKANGYTVIYDQIYQKFPRLKKKIEAFKSGQQQVFDIKTDGSKDENGCYSYKIHLHNNPNKKLPQPWDWEDALSDEQECGED